MAFGGKVRKSPRTKRILPADGWPAENKMEQHKSKLKGEHHENEDCVESRRLRTCTAAMQAPSAQ
jgi:hypothetical protein